jgi:aspartate aminotransferase-like enzyme
VPNIDPNELLEYSVVYTNRARNHMSLIFQSVMTDISATMKSVYSADAVAIVPGSGTFGMEAVARQLATDKNCLVIRNGWFSYRWTQIFDMGDIPANSIVLKARQTRCGPQQPFAPAPIEKVLKTIDDNKPDIVFAPHVETSSGILLPDDYLQNIANAVHKYGGLFVLDCIASGTIWVDMKAIGVDVLISAPQKGWSGSPCCALVMLSEAAREHVLMTSSSSFSCDLRKWLDIMETYEKGEHAYHSTMPTDSIIVFGDVIKETEAYGFDKVKVEQQQLGDRVRKLLSDKGMKSVAAPGFEAPGVIVYYTDDPEIQSGRKFAEQGLQIAAGVPLQCDEQDDFQTFRIGLFGLDKLHNIDRTVDTLVRALDKIL